MSETRQVEYLGPEVRTLKVEPGDVLVITYERQLSQGLCEHIHKQMSSIFPNNKALILDGGFKIGVVRSTESHATATQDSPAAMDAHQEGATGSV